MSEDSKQKAWLEHYKRLLNVEFDWDTDHLSYQPQVEDPPIAITTDTVKTAISQMKVGKAPGLSGIVVEVIRAAGNMGTSIIHDLAAAIILDGKVPSDWDSDKGKGDALERGNYRGLKLPEQVITWRGLWTVSSDSWCQSTIPSLASSQVEAQQTQSLLSGSCKRSI